ncbi:hypothetical protein [Actibacterium sp. 188UL27-1]|uniref:hypothetical protein n=1 Tax=Actibacterium sp. 188UL27-1 TaxID=2786961 RepID=UPI00195E015B|nr:hypothetical protein [Actibacterium sp. 188UL27-1]MBM7067393.1 hypothetical protein [Actibacterium sp. 188UL27-1]
MIDVVRIELYGPLRVLAPDGADLTPRSAKAQGLTALLATGMRMSRSRTWLQDKLWSDRGRPQGSASLRQVLTEMRRVLGPHKDCLIANRKTVAFDPVRVLITHTAPSETQPEFLEGIDVRDEEFEEWLRVQRSRMRAHQSVEVSEAAAREVTAPTRLKKRRLLMVNETAQSPGMEGFFADHFADAVARSLSEQISVHVMRGDACKPVEPDFVLRTRASIQSGMAGLRVSMEQGAKGVQLWSGSKLVQAAGAPPVDSEDVLRLVHEATEGVSEALYTAARLGNEGFDAAVLARIGLRKLFSMKKSEQLVADGMLSTAFDLHPRGVYLAWRVLLRIVMLIERHDGLPDDYEQEACDMARRAFELEPMNSMVLAACSNAALILQGDDDGGLEYAERSVQANPANPFAWDCLSMAALYNGRLNKAHRNQVRARHIAGNTPFGHWFDMGCAMTATTNGLVDEALVWARRSAATSPFFHPPLRYLIALYVHSGRMDQARDIVKQLKMMEPDFAVSQLVEDDAYPVNDLRRSKLLTKSALSPLG